MQLIGSLKASLAFTLNVLYGCNIIMTALPACPSCQSSYTYEDGLMFVCPECAYEWPKEGDIETAEDVVRDINGNVLNNGDTVTVTKDLKIKGSSSVIKVGTKVKNIRLIDGDHEIDCKIDGMGGMKLRAKFVRKV